MDQPTKVRPFPWVDVVCFCHEEELSPQPTTTTTITHSLNESAIEEDEEDHPSDNQQKSTGVNENQTKQFNKIPQSIWDPFSRYPLSSLYFCEHCHSHRCPRCVEEEIVCRYCPQCMFEVTPSSARADGNRCTRNCFRCPECFTGTTIVSTTKHAGGGGNRVNSPTSKGSTNTNTGSDEISAYTLSCPHCSWTSESVGLVFRKTTSLVSLVQASNFRNQTKVDERFQAMRDFYFQRSLEEGVTMAASSSRGAEYEELKKKAAAASSGKTSTFAEILERRIRDKSRKDPGSEIYEDIEEVDEGADQSDALVQATLSLFVEQDYKTVGIVRRDPIDFEQGFPLPQMLRAKRTKRCRGCHHILVKPESKPSATKFKIKLMALNYLPELRVSQFPPKVPYPTVLRANKTHTLLLTITNPMHVAMKVVLSAIPQDSKQYPHKVTIVTPSVDLGASSELWNEASLVSGVPAMFIKRESAVTKRVAVEGMRSSEFSIGSGGSGSVTGGNNSGSSSSGGSDGGASGGMYQRGRNWCTIAVEVVPSGSMEVLEIPLFVSFSFQVPDEDKEEGNVSKKRQDEDDSKAGKPKELSAAALSSSSSSSSLKSQTQSQSKSSSQSKSQSSSQPSSSSSSSSPSLASSEETISIGFWTVLGVCDITS